MSEDTVDLPVPDDPPDDDEAVELASLAVDDGKGGKMVPLSALIGSKKTQRELQKRVRELEPVAARVTELDERLGKAQPIIDALVADPKLRAQALRIANGTRTSHEDTDQPDDPDAAAYAEDMGWYLADGTTVDVARGQRVLTRLDQRNGRQTDERIRPYAGVTLNARAEENLRKIGAMTDDEGVPYASAESIREVAQTLQQQGAGHLLASDGVVDLVLNNAIGIDRRKKRTPKAADEPLYLAPAGGGRVRGPSSVDAELKGAFQRLGIDEKQGSAAVKRLEENASGRRGTPLGVK